MHSSLQKYFSISKWQSIAIIVLVIAILALTILSYCMPFFVKNNIATDEKEALEKLANNIVADTSTKKFTKYNDPIASQNASNIKAFKFNPNTLSEDGFAKLGLRSKTIAIILNYRNKNGKFYTKADVEKMYSLSAEEYAVLEPFIDLPEHKTFAKKEYTNTYTQQKRNPIVVEINTADTAMFNKLRGIGTTLAQRIVEYRKSIGGFYSIAQLKEVYGISDSVFTIIEPQLHVDKTKITTININTVSYQTLSVHPLFKNGTALALLKYRKAHNDKINNWEEIKTIPELKPETLEKIKAYLVY